MDERDQLGDDLVPDYLAQVAQGDDYGWPTRYWGVLRDQRVSADWAKPAGSSVRQSINARQDQKHLNLKAMQNLPWEFQKPLTLRTVSLIWL